MKQTSFRYFWLGLALLALFVQPSAAGAVNVDQNDSLTWGTGDLTNTKLSQVNFTGSVPSTVSNVITALKTAIDNHAADPNATNLSALATALTAYNKAITDARTAGTLGTIQFAASVPLTAAAGTADQRLFVDTNAASFHIADGKTLTIKGNENSSNDDWAALHVGFGGLFAVTGDGSIVFDSNTDGGGIINEGDGTVSFSGPATFTGNTTSWGGGIFNLGTVSFSGPATFTGNTAGGTADRTGWGGGICNWDGTVSFSDKATFGGNTANGRGGGIFNSSGTVSFFERGDLHRQLSRGYGHGRLRRLRRRDFQLRHGELFRCCEFHPQHGQLGRRRDLQLGRHGELFRSCDLYRQHGQLGRRRDLQQGRHGELFRSCDLYRQHGQQQCQFHLYVCFRHPECGRGRNP
ncbi:hypothetical protein LJC22_06785 [Desulfosarcina sp. OttesenSCG-928-G10]|nr:hypothetical protein [Desulfosarcina sp. OttesenSCG-928-G10]